MEKDEKLGIAKVLIAHDEKKNAFTGMFFGYCFGD